MKSLGVVSPQSMHFDAPLPLQSGASIAGYQLVYETYGELNADRSNAVLVCHALTGDQYVAETQPVTGKPGWWNRLVGPGLPIDTDRFFVICSNVLGGCMGSTGPQQEMTDEAGHGLGRPWVVDFPSVTIRDMVRAQKRLVEHLGIDRLLAELAAVRVQL